MEIGRRELLAVTATAGSVTLAGCTGSCSQGIPFLGTGMPHDGSLAVERVDTVPADATVVAFADLSPAERSLVETAVEEGVARACMDDEGGSADALRAFADRAGDDSTYLAYDGDRYALWVRVTDVVYAGTADPPDDDANPCC